MSKADFPDDGEAARHSLPSLLRPAEKQALDLLADWPWLSRRELAALLDVSEPRVSQLTVSLESHGLATRPRGAAGGWSLTDSGLALLARRDRTSVGAAKKRWSVSPLDEDEPFHWRNVSGSRSRQLLRNIDHTAAVHQFISALAYQARALGWEIANWTRPTGPHGTSVTIGADPARCIPTPSACCAVAPQPGPSSWSGSAAPSGPEP